MRNAALAVVLAFALGACASQGQKGADIEQRDLFDQQKSAAQQQQQNDAARQEQIAREQEELKRQLEEQQRRQQGAGQDPAIVRPLSDGGAGGQTTLKGDVWGQLKDPASGLAKRSVYYDYDSYSIKEEYVPVIDAHARLLMQHTDTKIKVEGNCDDRGSREYNLALGQRRADSVKRAMVLLGVSDKQIETVSFGAEKPVALGRDEESWAKNRRSDIVYPGEPK
ncbi:MAG TPA: peptidoglycan-associated lipoprotein Pal [Burkholderiales bacterium]|nr:peptidoglycan-associated lipoprotein Pal [Burkholderiales bacterium]